jgi:2-methylisocitrate lyase-like PEP mutase family enzyme
MKTQAELGQEFRELHTSTKPFVIPNPWDVGSARILESLGFKALATTSSGLAQAMGKFDGMVSLDEKIEHCTALAKAVNIPISADTENGFGHSPKEVARCIEVIAATGAVGASIEDFTGDKAAPIYDLPLAVERIQAAVEAARNLPFDFTLTARAENLLRANNDLDEAIRRLQAYESAGADVLYVPAINSLEQVRKVSGALTKPLNVLAPAFAGTATTADLHAAGAARISLGGALGRYVASALIEASNEMLNTGGLDWATRATPGKEVNALLRRNGENQS